MKGSPILQTLILLGVLACIALAGKIYIGNERLSAFEEVAAPTEGEGHSHFVSAELEIVFSTLPKSYKLHRMRDGKTGELLGVSQPNELVQNPCYHNIQFDPHKPTSYWLDVTWVGTPGKNARHFVKLVVSPEYGEETKYSFDTEDNVLEETFELGEERSHE